MRHRLVDTCSFNHSIANDYCVPNSRVNHLKLWRCKCTLRSLRWSLNSRVLKFGIVKFKCSWKRNKMCSKLISIATKLATKLSACSILGYAGCEIRAKIIKRFIKNYNRNRSEQQMHEWFTIAAVVCNLLHNHYFHYSLRMHARGASHIEKERQNRGAEQQK